MTNEEELLDYAGVAAFTGLTPATLRRYRSIGLLPVPDALPAPDRPRWRRATIEWWMANRPGRGSPGRPRTHHQATATAQDGA
jgi:predicted DNA-binding transcriptional regulator AlpA